MNAITARGLSKRYERSLRTAPYGTLREALVEAASRAASAFRRAPSSLASGRGTLGPGAPATLPLASPGSSSSPGSPGSSGRAADQNAFWALRDVSFDIAPGEVVGIIGANGAGKSTLLKVLSRITEPTSGEAQIRGRLGALLEVGTGFHPELTGRENVYLNGAVLGMRRAEIQRQFDAIVSFAEVEPFIDVPLKRYSSGMQLRLAFAVAAHLQPELLLVDEVLAVGDAAFQEKCLGRMGDIAHGGRTILFVSHNMSAVTALCDRVIWLEQGRIREDGPASETVKRYLRAVLGSNAAGNGFTSLDHRRDRKGDGALRIRHVRLLDSNGQPVSSFHTGEPVRIGLGYRLQPGRSGSSVAAGFTILNDQQQFITYCQSDFVGTTFRNVPEEGEFICSFDRLPLMPGRYTLNVGVKLGAASADGVLHAAEFEVRTGAFYPSKLLPPSGYGDVLFDYTWSLDEQMAPPPPEASPEGTSARPRAAPAAAPSGGPRRG